MFNATQHQSGRSYGLTLALLGTAVAAISLGTSTLSGSQPLGLVWLESAPPSVTFTTSPVGLGAQPSTLKISVGDSGAGLSLVTVSLSQNGKARKLIERAYSTSGVLNDEFTIELDPHALELRVGTATVAVSAHDRSVWRSSVSAHKDFTVDFTAPQVQPLSVQQNGTGGGAELLVFRYQGRPLAAGGVETSKGVAYASLPLSAFDSSKNFPEGLRFSLFPIPSDFVPSQETLQLAVRDDFGNSATAPFNYRIAAKALPQVEMGLSREFMRTKVPALRAKLQADNPGVLISGNDVADFKLVNEDLRKSNEITIRSVLAETAATPRMWRGAFVRPLAAAPTASFAENRRYLWDGNEISRSRHMGIDLADVAQARVGASNKGRVVFAGDLGIYGGLVVVDHGVGVSSLYGHLSSTSVKKGDMLEQGQEIGRTGMTGLAGGDHLHYEVRVQGEPVSPLAWFDAQWIKEHIEDKIESFAVKQPSAEQAQGSPKS